MNLTTRQLNILTISLTNFYDEVCKTGTTPEMKQDIMELSKLVSNEFAKSFSKALLKLNFKDTLPQKEKQNSHKKNFILLSLR
jgi:hypothetical protein